MITTRNLLLAGAGALIAAATILATAPQPAPPAPTADTGVPFLPWYIYSLKEGRPFPPDTCTHPTTLADLLAPCDNGGRP
jgi:hypothetical protein